MDLDLDKELDAIAEQRAADHARRRARLDTIRQERARARAAGKQARHANRLRRIQIEQETETSR